MHKVIGQALKILGLAAVGSALGASAPPDGVFAKQFACKGVHIVLPSMVYDPDLQMMVDPATRVPIYDDAGKMRLAENLPTVTAGCSDCPKCDDYCQ